MLPSRKKDRYFPDASRRDTLKSSIRSSLPEIVSPDGIVTLTVIALRAVTEAPPRPPPRGPSQRCCRDMESKRLAIPARSPAGEWHLLHPPEPLKYASPFFASPVTTSWNA